MRGSPRCSSLNRWLPASSSRRISGVQRSANTSAPSATGQNWPYPRMPGAWAAPTSRSSSFLEPSATRGPSRPDRDATCGRSSGDCRGWLAAGARRSVGIGLSAVVRVRAAGRRAGVLRPAVGAARLPKPPTPGRPARWSRRRPPAAARAAPPAAPRAAAQAAPWHRQEPALAPQETGSSSRRSPGTWWAPGWDGSRPSTTAGFAMPRTVWLSAPVPQPTSSQAAPPATFSRATNSRATGALSPPGRSKRRLNQDASGGTEEARQAELKSLDDNPEALYARLTKDLNLPDHLPAAVRQRLPRPRPVPGVRPAHSVATDAPMSLRATSRPNRGNHSTEVEHG
jgi:hypothetical protein